jgi:hypothetical protein
MPPRLVAGFSLSLAIPALVSASNFKTNCTLPPPNTNFVSGPNTRGTLTILWNCLSVILLCTWNIQHLNVPSGRPYYDENGRKFGFWRKLWWSFVDTVPKVWWMILTILVPEYIMGKALHESLAAASMVEHLRRRFGPEIELVHAYIMNMGGYYLDFSDIEFSNNASVSVPVPENKNESPETESSPPQGQANQPSETSNGESFIVIGSQASSRQLIFGRLVEKTEKYMRLDPRAPRSENLNLARLRRDKWVLTARQILNAKDQGMFRVLPPVSAQELEQLSKGDTIVKLLAILQICWLMLQLLSRAIRDLPSSQFEIAALAFAFTSLVTYAILWNQPREIEHRYRIVASMPPEKTMMASLVQLGPGFLWCKHRFEIRKDRTMLEIPNDASHSMDFGELGLLSSVADMNTSKVLIIVVGSVLGGTLFGGLHCLAWNFHFPTTTEALLWRICSIATAVLPILSLYFSCRWAKYVSGLSGWKPDPIPRYMFPRLYGYILVAFFLVPYILARLFLLVEIFRSLFFLPPEAFRDTWSGSFPHLGM